MGMGTSESSSPPSEEAFWCSCDELDPPELELELELANLRLRNGGVTGGEGGGEGTRNTG